MNKIGFVVTTHYSKKICPNGKKNLKRFLDSFLKVRKNNYYLCIVDNSSIEKFKHSGFTDDYMDYYYIENQDKNGGITGAWNFGISKMVEKGCDIILNMNNDLILNETIHEFIEIINNHPNNDVGLFGPVTRRSGLSTDHQARESSGDKIIETTNYYALNGFFYGFTKEFYQNFNMNGNLFSTEEKYKWDGQEKELFNRCTKDGMRSFIVENCFIEHIKERSWMNK